MKLIDIVYGQESIVTCQFGSCGWGDLWGKGGIIEKALQFGIKIVVPLAIIAVIYGAIRLIASGGKEGNIKVGRAAIVSAIVGVAIVFGANIIYTSIYKAIIGSG